MKQRPGDAGRDGQEFALAGKDFNLQCARDVRKVGGAAASDPGGGGFVGSNRGKLREEFSGMKEERWRVRIC